MTLTVLTAACVLLAYMHATTLARLRSERHAHLDALTAAWREDVAHGHDNSALLAALVIAIGRHHGVGVSPGAARQVPGVHTRFCVRGEVPPPFAAELSARVYGGAGVSERDDGWTHFYHRDDLSPYAREEMQ